MMEVDVPLISKVYIDGTEKTDYEAVTLNRVANGATNSTSIFSAANTLESDVAENWTLLGTATITDKSNNKYKAYYFGYNTVLDGKTDTATASTSALFTSIQIPNITKLETNFPGEVLIKAQFVQQSDDYDSIAGAYHKYFKGQVATNVTDLVSAPTSTSTENN
jgi:hypothetical protein